MKVVSIISLFLKANLAFDSDWNLALSNHIALFLGSISFWDLDRSSHEFFHCRKRYTYQDGLDTSNVHPFSENNQCYL